MERAFVARRGGAAVASPADWQLILDWERRGVPLPVVLEGLDRAFERRLAPSPRLALRACSGAVEAAFAGYRRRRAGLPVPDSRDSGDGAFADRSPPASSARRPARSPARRLDSPAEEGTPAFDAGGRLPAVRGDGLGGSPRDSLLDRAGAAEAPGASSKPAAPLREARSGTAGRGARWSADLARWRPDPAALPPEDAAAAIAAARGRLARLAAGPPPDAASAGADPGTIDAEPNESDDEILEGIEADLLRRLAGALREPLRSQAEASAAAALAGHRRRMPPDGYRDALAAAVRRRLPRLLGLPPLPPEPAFPETPNRTPARNRADREARAPATRAAPPPGPAPSCRPRSRPSPSDSPAAAPSSTTLSP